jgi:hypothetical protein
VYNGNVDEFGSKSGIQGVENFGRLWLIGEGKRFVQERQNKVDFYDHFPPVVLQFYSVSVSGGEPKSTVCRRFSYLAVLIGAWHFARQLT